MARKKPLSKRAKDRLARMRRDPFGRLTLEVNRYLNTVGWNAVVMGEPQVRGFETGRTVGNYEFTVTFSGGRLPTARAADAVAGDSKSARTLKRERKRQP